MAGKPIAIGQIEGIIARVSTTKTAFLEVASFGPKLV
jgi:hypothetical protein